MNIPSDVFKNTKVQASIPEGTLMRTGPVNGSLGKQQFDIVDYDNLTPEQKNKIFKTIKD